MGFSFCILSLVLRNLDPPLIFLFLLRLGRLLLREYLRLVPVLGLEQQRLVEVCLEGEKEELNF